MIEDTTVNASQIPDTSFTYTPQISRFMQALEYNMKARAGIDPAVLSEDIAAQRNLEMEEDNIAATERTLTSIDHSDPETMKSILDSYRAYGRLLRSNPATAVIESFTDADIADKIVSDGVFRINATNTDQDYPVYMTRGAIFESELMDNLENDNPSLYSYVRRFGAPVGLGIAGKVVKGSTGMFVAHGATAAYDVTRLGTSIKNIQKKYHEWRNRLLNDETLTYDMFLEESKKLFADLKKEVPEEYRYEVYRALQEAPDPFADLGNSFTGLAADVGLIKPISGVSNAGYTAAKKAMKGIISKSSKSKNVQKLQYNEELAEKIKNFATNKVDEEVVEDAINTKAAVNTPQEASPELQDTVKGIVREQESDNNLLQNVNNDSYRYETKQNKMLQAELKSQKGEINLERPIQNYFIDHGKGVDGNQPMTLEEAERELKQLQGRKSQVLYRERYIREENLDEAPEYVAITTASKTPWDSLHVEYRPRTGEGSEAYGGGMYATFADSDWEASRKTYFKNALEKSDKAVLNTHYIPNPEKHPEMYLYYDAEDPGLKPFAINVLNTKSDKYFKIAEKQQKIIRSAIKDIESGLQKRIQDAIKEGKTDLVNQLQFDHSFLLDHYDGDMTIFSWSDYLRENVYGLDKPREGFRRWEKEYWKNKGIKGLIHEGEGSTSTNIVIFDEDITSPVTKVETVDTQTGYNNAHMIVSAGDGVGYFIRELHGIEGSKPMIIKNYKVIDKGDWK